MKIVENLNKVTMCDSKKSNYSYRITEIEFRGMNAYGIEIERLDYEGENLINISRDSVNKISPKVDKVKQILNILYNYEVSPIHLIDIIGEYVDEYVSDFENCA